MPMHNGFFSQLSSTWGDYNSLRAKYADGVPIPQRKYFRPIESIDDLATLAIRPIEKPLWLGLHTLSYLLNVVLCLAASILLAPCALVLALIAPRSDLSRNTSSTFKLAAAHTLVSAGMSALALIYTAMSLIFNPLFIASRAAATVVSSINSTTESCCGLTIAKC